MSGDSVPPEYLAEVLSATWMQGSCRSQHRAQVGEDMMRHSASKGWWGSPLFCIQLICVHLNSPSPLALFLAHPGQSRHHITIIISLTRSHTPLTSPPLAPAVHTPQPNHCRGQLRLKQPPATSCHTSYIPPLFIAVVCPLHF